MLPLFVKQINFSFCKKWAYKKRVYIKDTIFLDCTDSFKVEHKEKNEKKKQLTINW